MKYVNDYQQCCYDFYEKRTLKTTYPIVHQDVFEDFLAQRGVYSSYYSFLTSLLCPSVEKPLDLITFAKEEGVITYPMLQYVIHHSDFNEEIASALYNVIEEIGPEVWPHDDEITLVITLCYVRYGYHKRAQKTMDYILELKGAFTEETWTYWLNKLGLNEVNMFYPRGYLKDLCSNTLTFSTYPKDLDNPFYNVMPQYIQWYRDFHKGARSLVEIISQIGTETKLKSFYKNNTFLDELLEQALLSKEYESINRLVSNMVFYGCAIDHFETWFLQQSKDVQYYFIAMPKLPQSWTDFFKKIQLSDDDVNAAQAHKERYKQLVELLEPTRVNGTSISRYWTRELKGHATMPEETIYLS